jgi:hypothetical protein
MCENTWKPAVIEGPGGKKTFAILATAPARAVAGRMASGGGQVQGSMQQSEDNVG